MARMTSLNSHQPIRLRATDAWLRALLITLGIATRAMTPRVRASDPPPCPRRAAMNPANRNRAAAAAIDTLVMVARYAVKSLRNLDRFPAPERDESIGKRRVPITCGMNSAAK